MAESMITFGVVMVIVAFGIFILKDSKLNEGKEKKKEKKEKEKKNFKDFLKQAAPKRREVVLANGPEILIRCEGEKEYQKNRMTKPSYSLGGESADLPIDSPVVEEKHAVIRQCMEGNERIFVLTNYGKTNTMQWYNQEESVFEWLDYKEEIVLLDFDIFYIGDIKIVIKTPKSHRTNPPTEMDTRRDNPEGSAAQRRATQNYVKKRTRTERRE